MWRVSQESFTFQWQNEGKIFVSTTLEISQYYLKVVQYHILQLERKKLSSYNSY